MDDFTIKDIVSVGIGLTGGLAVALYIYVRQQKDSSITHGEIVNKLDRILEEAQKNSGANPNHKGLMTKIMNEVEALSDPVEIKEEINKLVSHIKLTKKGQGPSFDDIFRYKALGEKWSELVSTNLGSRIISEKGMITISRLLAVHKSIFPDDFPWAGIFRKDHVYVVENFGTTVNVVDVVQAQSKTETIPPEAIAHNLNKLLSYWNENVLNWEIQSPEIKINEVIKFHHEFELIHPFLDGNGRIGRMILEEQLSFLFKVKVSFSPNKDDYYKALRMMDMGHNDFFKDLISKELVDQLLSY